jgi:hypothetical protein
VHAGGARQLGAIVAGQGPGIGHLSNRCKRRRFHALGLRCVDPVALHQRRDGGIARIVRTATAQHVVQRAFAQCRLADMHALQAHTSKARLERSRPPAMMGLRSLDRPGRSISAMVSACKSRSAHEGRALRRHRALGDFISRADFADALMGPRTRAPLPAQRAIHAANAESAATS